MGYLDDVLGDRLGDDFWDDHGDGVGDDFWDDYGDGVGVDLLDGDGNGFLDDLGEADGGGGLGRLVDVLRQGLHEDYADASDEDVEHALTGILGTMGPAEALNFSSAISQIGRGAGSLLSDPTFGSIARTALPVAGGALGTAVGGPLGAAIVGQLAGKAAGAIPTRPPAAPGPRPMVPTTVPVVPAPAAAPAALAASAAPAASAAAVAPTAVAGSDAAKKALVLTRQSDVVQSLLAAALGQYGRQQVAGVPVAQVLGTLSQLLGQAAADADELAYLSGSTGDAESESDDGADGDDLYEALLDADDLELADAYQGWDES